MRRNFLPVAAAMLCILAAPAHAHEEHRSNLDVILDGVTPHPPRLEVRIVNTLAPQMIVTNHTGQTLEILDGRGIPVVRIGPDRTWVNASAPAYYAEHPMSDRANAAALSKEPRWVLASHEPSWGWFDPPNSERRRAKAHNLAYRYALGRAAGRRVGTVSRATRVARLLDARHAYAA